MAAFDLRCSKPPWPGIDLHLSRDRAMGVEGLTACEDDATQKSAEFPGQTEQQIAFNTSYSWKA